MKYPTTRIIFDRNRRASRTNVGLVQIEVTLLQKRKFVSTGVKVFSHEWSDKTKVKGRTDMMDCNRRIEAVYQNINNYITDLMECGKAWDWDAFEHFLDREPATRKNTFLNFVEDRLEKRTDIKAGTSKHHYVWFRDFVEYGKISKFSTIYEEHTLQPIL